MAWLAYSDKRRELPDGETIVGSGAMATWRISGLDLLPRHFVITVRHDAVSVRPFGTDDVVALNGRQVGGDACRLSDGDIIEAGAGRFRFTAAMPNDNVDEAPAANRGAAHLIDHREHVAYALGASTGIGRDPSNVVLLHDPTASRFHAEIRREAGGYVLHGMGSSGTKLNGSRLGTPALLDENDEIEIAYTSLRFTRAALPPDVMLAPPHPSRDDDALNRPTITMEQERTSLPDPLAMPAASRPSTAPILPWIVVALLAIALVLVLLNR